MPDAIIPAAFILIGYSKGIFDNSLNSGKRISFNSLTIIQFKEFPI